ncbi:hypothetical protein FN846DRAFT_68693 [Sphaerosporella brunnea]|uniref:Uncharacterized protein n=1 Tax=Sphaerosporella brunnea TaxID=1250544 RepID=A0A5J5EU63_9PEZI|nr:hypothetical protein FN846DRAFT_68693 [Sphaerosporella brunnea]
MCSLAACWAISQSHPRTRTIKPTDRSKRSTRVNSIQVNSIQFILGGSESIKCNEQGRMHCTRCSFLAACERASSIRSSAHHAFGIPPFFLGQVQTTSTEVAPCSVCSVCHIFFFGVGTTVTRGARTTNASENVSHRDERPEKGRPCCYCRFE